MTDLLAIHAAAAAKSTRDLVRSFGVRQSQVLLELREDTGQAAEAVSGRVDWWGFARFGFLAKDGRELSIPYERVVKMTAV